MFKKKNKNLNVRFKRTYQNHNNEILQTRKETKEPQFMMVKFQNVIIAQDVFRPIPGLFSCSVIFYMQ